MYVDVDVLMISGLRYKGKRNFFKLLLYRNTILVRMLALKLNCKIWHKAIVQ